MRFVRRYVAPGRPPAPADALMRENEQLRKELETHAEKTARLHKVREEGAEVLNFVFCLAVKYVK